MRILIFMVFILLLPDNILAFDFELEPESFSKIEKTGNEQYSVMAANVTLLLLLIGNVPIFAKMLYAINSRGAYDMRPLLPLHMAANLLAFFGTLLHGHWAGATSVILILSGVTMLALILPGAILVSFPDLGEEDKKFLLKLKRTFFGSFLFLVVIGHILVFD